MLVKISTSNISILIVLMVFMNRALTNYFGVHCLFVKRLFLTFKQQCGPSKSVTSLDQIPIMVKTTVGFFCKKKTKLEDTCSDRTIATCSG